MEAEQVAPPLEPVLRQDDAKTILQQRLRTVLLGLPAFFEFNNHISGVNATDLYSLNTLLGASIEGQVVKALNQQRALWDPDDEWLGYTFERQSQAFPDVRLVRKGASSAGIEIALGIELKGWFLLSKEGEPSFRFITTAAACADHDLLVVVPWYLDNVLSGSPVAAEPFVASAKWAAEYRNYYWQHLRRTRGDVGIASPDGAHPYPSKADLISDVPAYDGGGNFGRVARAEGLMTDWVKRTNEIEVLGVRIKDWYQFLRLHSDQADPDDVTFALYQQLLTANEIRAHQQALRATEAVKALLRAYGVDRDL
ncbi:hypothetical protein FHG89_25955 [Micromonospora orduensis]|uniref:Uncharacterized protein n=1 Tax=Micromonospora orduensis TaxID=1420891 RepID=A0A5C4QG66_9ACTN|nr:hypothetical protein [Micromonospora orduensis]TNH23957.1 hypothetical protein FHG89_25955 [Micromonospora orduensis]